MRVSVKGDVRAVLEDLRRLDAADGPVHAATASALLRAGTTVVSRSSREIAKRSGLPARLVRGRFGRVGNRGRRRLAAVWRVRLSPVPVRILGTARENRRGVNVGRRAYPGAFLATGSHGQAGVFRRKGAPRLPIEELFEPLTDAESIIDRHMNTTGPERFRLEFKRAVRVALRDPRQLQRRRRR